MARDAPARSCEQVQRDFRSEHPALDRRGHMTRAVMCDVDPPCVTELLFAHEFYQDERAAARPSRCGGSFWEALVGSGQHAVAVDGGACPFLLSANV